MPMTREQTESVNRFMVALRRYLRAFYMLSRGSRLSENLWHDYDTAFREVLATLHDQLVEGSLNALIAEAAKSRVQEALSPQGVTIEVQLASRVGFKNRESKELLLGLLQLPPQEITSLTAVVIRDKLQSLHHASKVELARSEKETRRDKKRRKRNVAQGVSSGVFGACLIAGDSLFPSPLSVASCGLGGTAIFMAMRDLIGEPPDKNNR